MSEVAIVGAKANMLTTQVHIPQDAIGEVKVIMLTTKIPIIEAAVVEAMVNMLTFLESDSCCT
jgi:hypothetical protein